MTLTDRLERSRRLSPAKRALLLKAMQEEAAGSEQTWLIPRRNEQSPCHLSFAQHRLWFLDQLEPGSSAFNLPATVRLKGRLDIPALEQALGEIVQRHEGLRTAFCVVSDRPMQVIAPTLAVKLPEVDLSDLSEPEREVLACRLAEEDAERPFDLTRGPLLRATLLRLGQQNFIVLFNMHHIISDGWSIGVLIRELGVLYEAFSVNKPSPLPDLPIQYADYALWQRERLQGEALQTQLSYWKQQLSGMPPALDLPTDRSRPTAQSNRGAAQSLALPGRLSDTVRASSEDKGETLFMTLLAAFKALLHRYTEQDDIVVGTLIAGRNRLELEGTIGFFVNMLALRTNLSGNPSFKELLERVEQVVIDAYVHQDVPFERLIEELNPERDINRAPLFQVMLVLQNTPNQSLQLPGLELSLVEGDRWGAEYDLVMEIFERAEGLTALLRYNSNMFDPITITRMLNHYQVLLEGAVAHPEQRLSDLPLMSAAEQHQVLRGWNDTKTDYSLDKGLHQLFEEQVERTPNATALIFEDERVSYGELNRRANQLAHHLRRLGVGPEVRVGICIERSVEMIVGLLGILKAGAAYVPLDPAYPAERLAYIMENAQVPVLLTQERLISKLAECRARVVRVDSERETVKQESEDNPDGAAMPGQVAYVIYTSGSTGNPKGVVGLHGGIVNRLKWMWEAYPFDRHEVCCQKTSLSFLDSAWEIFGPMLQAIPTLIIPNDVVKDPYRLVESLAVNKVTRVVLVPSLLRVMLDAFDDLESKLPRLKYWVASGEALPAELYERFRKSKPGGVLLNLYGSSEVAADSTWYETKPNESRQSVPIGRPIANTQIYLLNSHLRPVPIGVGGQLHIGGAGLARGYLNHPELTAEKFIPSPFSSEPGARLYRTGDLARYLADGNIEYLGRSDHQVKIRGYRVELGEVETMLRLHPLVRDVVVTAQEETFGAKRLVAYVVTNQESPPAINELKIFLKEKMPEYMVPYAFVVLDALPLTPNGKVDRRRLPAPQSLSPEQEEAYIPPRTPTEDALADIWTQVLGVEYVGVHDNFFELGGHSLLLTQIMLRAHDVFRIQLSLRKLFESPTLAGMAAAIEESRLNQQYGEIPRIKPLPRGDKDFGDLLAKVSQFSEYEVNRILGEKESQEKRAIEHESDHQTRLADLSPQKRKLFDILLLEEGSQFNTFPLSFAQQRLWFFDQLVPESSLYNVAAAVRLTGRLNVAALGKSLSEIIGRHESLRTRFAAVAGKPVQVIVPSLIMVPPMVDLSEIDETQREAEAQLLANILARQPFKLSEGPLLRATLLRVEEQEHIAVFVMHHIISDGWSMSVLLREITTLYEAHSSNRPPSLPDLRIQYADFAVWQTQWMQGEVLEKQLEYWRRQLEDASILELPTDRARPSEPRYTGATETLDLPRELARSLKEMSRGEGVTLFMILLAAYKVLLYRYTGQEDIVVGTDTANRNPIETEGLIGFFVNQLVLRTDLSGDPSFREILKRVEEVALSAYVNQDLPFEKLVRELQPHRNMGVTPLFRTKFIFQPATLKMVDAAGLKLSRVDVETGTAPFELVLSMLDRGEELTANMIYSTELFNRATIKRMLDHFQTLLQAIVADVEQRISMFHLLTEAETQGYSPLDFPDAELSQKDFENLLMEISLRSDVQGA